MKVVIYVMYKINVVFQSSLQYPSLKRSVKSNSLAQESVATTTKDTEEKTQEEDEEEKRQRLTTELHEIERERWVLFGLFFQLY